MAMACWQLHSQAQRRHCKQSPAAMLLHDPCQARCPPQPRALAPASILGSRKRCTAVAWTMAGRWVQTSVTPLLTTTVDLRAQQRHCARVQTEELWT